MPRRYWRAIVAAVLAIIILPPLGYTAYQLYNAAEQRNASYQYQPSANPRGTVVGVPKTPAKAYQPNCKNPQSNGDADLCAQWAAVQQVSESNRLISLNTQMAVFSLLATIAATGLLIWTFKETRSTSRRELRAYIFPENVGIYCLINQIPKVENGKVGSTVHIKNTGQTPAYNVRHVSHLAIWEQSDEAALIADTLVGAPSNSMPPGGIVTASRRMKDKLTRQQQAGLKNGKLAIYVFGRIEYTDAFGNDQFTVYKFGYAAWPLNENLTMTFASTGNEAT
jgi:hypothetical protein